MDSLKKVLAIFMLAVFVAYSGGVGFSVHNCEHCHKKKVYLFQHPDCCSAAKAEHHHHAEDCENDCCASDAVCCGHQTVKKTNAPHCQPCCFSDFQYYKIQGKYFVPQCETLADVVVFCLFTEALSFKGQCIPPKINFSENWTNPPPLLQGGERFLIFSHQLLFYA